MDPDEYGGCPLLGVQGVFIITHGSAGRLMLKNGTLAAAKCIRENLVDRIREHLPNQGGQEA
jgi:glycerol-3-phosphate acyltransferase PlsX